MAVILAILKWIGIVLGGILGLLLFLTALLLLVPARYCVRGTGNQTDVRYYFRVSWLLRIVEMRKKKDSQAVRLYLFGIPVYRLAGEEKKDKRGADSGAEQKEDAVSTESKKNGESASAEQQEKTFSSVEKIDKTSKTKKRRKKGKKTKGRRKEKRKKAFSFDRVSSIIKFVKDMDNRRAFRKIRREMYLLLRYLAPRKVRGQFVIGTGDPSTTGLLFGGISLLPFVYHDGVHITPDFEEKIFRAEGYMKGRIRVLYLIRLIIRIYRDKELRMLWKNVNQVKKKEAA